MNAITNAIARLVALYRREPAATQTALAVIYGGGLMIYRAFVEHTTPWSWQVAGAAAVALYGLLVRAQVIPVITFNAVRPGAPVGAGDTDTETRR